MKMILSHLRSDWYKYVLELIVITAGILGAYALNNWNEERKSERQKLTMLANLKDDLKRDIGEIDHTTRLILARKERALRLLELFNGLPAEVDSLDVLLDLDKVGFGFTFHPIVPTYNEMQGTGTIGLINSVELKTKLASYVSLIQKNASIEEFNAPVLKNYENNVIKHMDPGLGKTNVNQDAPDSYKLIRFDLKSMSEDEDLINALKSIVNISNEEVLFKIQIIKPALNTLIELIDTETHSN